MQEYRAARFVIWLMAIAGWLTVAAAVILPVAVWYLDRFPVDPLRLAGFAVAGVFAGLAQVAGAQIVAAQIDTARNTAEMVALLRRERGRAAEPLLTPSGRREPPVSRPGDPG